MYFVKTPKVIHSIFKDAIWKISGENKVVYLTFDDGPTEDITEETLNILEEHQVKATFFCLGQQVENHPEIFDKIKKLGHQVGNHSYSHLKGWATSNEEYLSDIKRAQFLIDSTLFRPPYGKAKRSQLKSLKDQFKIIFWDVLPGDFSPKNSVEQIINNTVDNVENGSIIVLHDNDKCGNKMNKALPAIITELKEKGFQFAVIPD